MYWLRYMFNGFYLWNRVVLKKKNSSDFESFSMALLLTVLVVAFYGVSILIVLKDNGIITVDQLPGLANSDGSRESLMPFALVFTVFFYFAPSFYLGSKERYKRIIAPFSSQSAEQRDKNTKVVAIVIFGSFLALFLALFVV
ncbi:MAG: hypothetical protein AB8B86_11575 [Pseudomonadales bacterium]